MTEPFTIEDARAIDRERDKADPGNPLVFAKYVPRIRGTNRNSKIGHHPVPAIATVTLKEISLAIRKLRAEMRRLGIRRSSMMNGGHNAESMRANEEMFRLQTLKQRITNKR